MGATPTRLRLPDFDLPYPRAINPSATAIVRHTVRWAREIGLVADEAALIKLERDGIIHAGPRLVPHARREHACLVSDWTLFLIVLDDEFDERDLGSRPDVAEAAISGVLAGSGGGAGRAHADLRGRFERLAPTPEWLRRFSAHAEDHIGSKVVEARQRAFGRPLGVADYVALRRITGAPYTYADLAELVSGARVSGTVRESRDWDDLLAAFADVFLAIQDICSCGKEVAGGDDLNLAVAIQREAACTLQEAVERANEWLLNRAQCYADATERALGVAEEAGAGAAEVRRCVDAFDALLGGHLAWNSEDNPRYTAYARPA